MGKISESQTARGGRRKDSKERPLRRKDMVIKVKGQQLGSNNLGPLMGIESSNAHRQAKHDMAQVLM